MNTEPRRSIRKSLTAKLMTSVFAGVRNDRNLQREKKKFGFKDEEKVEEDLKVVFFSSWIYR